MRESRVLLHEFADLVTVAHRHENIRQYQIGIRFRKAADGGLAVADCNDADAALFKRQHHHLLDVGVVVGDHNSGHWNPLAARPQNDTPTAFTTTIASIPGRSGQRGRSTVLLQLSAGGNPRVYHGTILRRPFFFLLVDSSFGSVALGVD